MCMPLLTHLSDDAPGCLVPGIPRLVKLNQLPGEARGIQNQGGVDAGPVRTAQSGHFGDCVCTPLTCRDGSTSRGHGVCLPAMHRRAGLLPSGCCLPPTAGALHLNDLPGQDGKTEGHSLVAQRCVHCPPWPCGDCTPRRRTCGPSWSPELPAVDAAVRGGPGTSPSRRPGTPRPWATRNPGSPRGPAPRTRPPTRRSCWAASASGMGSTQQHAQPLLRHLVRHRQTRGARAHHGQVEHRLLRRVQGREVQDQLLRLVLGDQAQGARPLLLQPPPPLGGARSGRLECGIGVWRGMEAAQGLPWKRPLSFTRQPAARGRGVEDAGPCRGVRKRTLPEGDSVLAASSVDRRLRPAGGAGGRPSVHAGSVNEPGGRGSSG